MYKIKRKKDSAAVTCPVIDKGILGVRIGGPYCIRSCPYGDEGSEFGEFTCCADEDASKDEETKTLILRFDSVGEVYYESL